MPRNPKDSGKRPPSVKTIKGRQAIVDWMRKTVGLSQADLRTELDGWQIRSFMLWAWSDPHGYRSPEYDDPGSECKHGPFFKAGEEQATRKQLEDGHWPDDDTALLVWWKVVGKQRYEDWEGGYVYSAEHHLPDDPEPGPVCEALDDSPASLSFQQILHDGPTREEKIEHLCNSPLT